MSHLGMAAERLHEIEQLLLCPTPAAIREAERLLGEVARGVAAHREEARANADEESDAEAVGRFRVVSKRVGKLLEGARRAQWIRMRLITSLTQTYTARAETKIWVPPHGSVNIQM